ncbi:MAG: hypothetical protein U0350_08770 [Caldilineaceae bacterium]
MKLIVPVSACLSVPTEFRQAFKVLGQRAQVGAEWVYIDKNRIDAFQAKQNASMRFSAIALGELVQWLDRLEGAEEIVLLSPTSNFDATPYANLISSILHQKAQIFTCSFNCYGHALAFLLQGAVSFVRKYNPSAAQLTLFVDALNDSVKSYLVCCRAQAFEPTLTTTQIAFSGLYDLVWRSASTLVSPTQLPVWCSTRFAPTLYQASALGWQLCAFSKLGASVTANGDKNLLVWVDEQAGAPYVQSVVHHYRQLGFSKQNILCNPLNYVSRTFPKQFALVTVTPNKASIERMSNWVLRYQ